MPGSPRGDKQFRYKECAFSFSTPAVQCSRFDSVGHEAGLAWSVSLNTPQKADDAFYDLEDVTPAGRLSYQEDMCCMISFNWNDSDPWLLKPLP
jgi:hypothetical protein